MSEPLMIRRAAPEDWAGIWRVLEPVFREGESYMVDPLIGPEEAWRLWMKIPRAVYVACRGEEILGSYYLKPNQPGPGDHLCNAGFAVRPDARGRGIARAMGEHALKEAVEAGYEGMQFNAVVSTNEAALTLWKALGFEIVGTVPEAFRSPRHGRVAIYVMYRRLATLKE